MPNFFPRIELHSVVCWGMLSSEVVGVFFAPPLHCTLRAIFNGSENWSPRYKLVESWHFSLDRTWERAKGVRFEGSSFLFSASLQLCDDDLW